MSVLNDLTQLFRKDPRPAFHFLVSFGSTFTVRDTSFREVSGIGPEIQVMDIPEGGENRFVHRVPKGIKHPKLSLKRGIAELDSPLVTWCKDCLESDFSLPITPMDVTVRLLNENHLPAAVWNFADAYPVHWEVEGFHSMKNEVAIEKIELVYRYCTRESTTWL
jgi:phage tail-like protein